jgi:hypothetical protein
MIFASPHRTVAVTLWVSAIAAPAVAQHAGARTLPLRPRERMPCTIMAPPGGYDAVYVPNTWPNGIVPYEFDDNATAGTAVNQANRQIALTAMAQIEAIAAIDFVPRTNQTAYIHIQSDSQTNSSWVGYLGTGQIVRIESWSWNAPNPNFIIVHELMHALGIFHEQQRTDRNSFVTINVANIQSGAEPNFTIQNGSTAHGVYDYDSVMHYDRCAFSTCCPTGSWCNCAATCETITALQAIGQLNHLSMGDVAVLRFLYPGCSTWNLACNSCTPGPRHRHAIAYDAARSSIVLYGGRAQIGQPQSTAGDTWTWNGATWLLASSSGPGPRESPAMVYEASQSRVLLFGGDEWLGASTFTRRDDTWVWNGTSWTRVATLGPAPRYRHAMAYDAQRGVIVLFGGSTSTNEWAADTWEWSSGSWTQRVVSGPPGRMRHAMAYDSTRGRVVLFGGETSTTAYARDTWEWNGSVWELRDSNGPEGSYAASMSIGAGGRPVLFGGQSATGSTNATSEWTGAGWSQLTTGGPSGRSSGAMAYDSANRRVITYGGVSANSLSDMWAFACGSPGNPTPCYANCDGSSTPPVLNVGDFTCFLQQFAGGQLYANCDQSMTPPILNVGDFTCFLQRFATGCP